MFRLDEEHTGRGNLQLRSQANWPGQYTIAVGTDLKRNARSAHGRFKPDAPIAPRFLLDSIDRNRATLTLEDGRTVKVNVSLNGDGSVDFVGFEENPFPA